MTSAPEQWSWLRSGPGSPAFNMALDEALLEAMPRLRHPVLRFYAWTDPAASFGYFQRHEEVERLTPLRPLIRRPTAGGIVPHKADWTYSLCLPAGSPWHQARALESYAQIHRWIQAAFLDCGVKADLAERAAPSSGQCFVGWEQFDLLWNGRKIAGAAQRRTRSGLLIQGSIQPAGWAITRMRWEEAMLRVGPRGHQVEWRPFPADQDLLQKTGELEQRKYQRPDWNSKR